jgi:anaerobic selenocysteine-containing dehydrogenase
LRAAALYTSGQLFLEEYYTLATIVRGGLGSNHLDGNTRLCTATAGEALKESFGCDGQPASYDDVNHPDAIALFGHNVAETQPVLWMRILDRLEGADPPRLVVVDPRLTVPAQHATVHLPIRPGTNVALLNALQHELLTGGHIDEEFLAVHAIGLEDLRAQVASCTPEWAAGICDVDACLIREAAVVIGSARRLLCTVQDVYQSHQATAAACQVNNLVLLRGMLGRPGCGVLQMNGQPTAQNTRETGADGDLPGFRNWANDNHVEDLARIWNVDPMQIPHYGPPTHAMEMVRYMEEGSLPFFWVSATNPLVSLPEAQRIRSVFEQERVFLVVQDVFLTETAAVADVVLPAATQTEKTGTFTNADRTVHLSRKAVDPPGQARPDLDIWLDYAQRLQLRDKDGAPLIKWTDPESALEAFKTCITDRPCSYDGITYAVLDEGGCQWGGDRLYADGHFFASPEECETYGRDLLTGAARDPAEYRALNPEGKAMLRAAEYTPPMEALTDEHPLRLNTGRTIYQFHTRTKTVRAPQLQQAAPEVWIEVSAPDAARLSLAEGDLARVESPRGAIEGRVRVSGIREGVVFVPVPRSGWVKPETDQRLSDHISIGVLTRVFPPELVDRVVAEAGRVEQRHRLLPARVVVYYVLAMALLPMRRMRR